MSDHVHDQDMARTSGSAASSFRYPWAAAPDIIRSNQKDAYFQSVLLGELSAVIRSLYGARTAHNWTNEARTFTELLYLGLTTFVGNRTLGEEYCDIVQIEDDTHRLPALSRRSGYILSSVLLPYLLPRFLPALRRRLRAKLESSIRRAHQKHRRSASSSSQSSSATAEAGESKATSYLQPSFSPTITTQLQSYILKHLDTITSPSPLHALTLATFYFTGAYYQLSKRLFGLRYIFTRQISPSPGDDQQRAGYEVLGILLVLQMLVQSYLHFHETYSSYQSQQQTTPSNNAASGGSSAILSGSGGVEIATDTTISAPLLFEPPPQGSADPAIQRDRLSKITHTPLPGSIHRFDLQDAEVMPWIEGKQARKCTLCLEAMKDPAATTCGHVFCWTCVTDWLREQPMCPLCRQGARAQHVLPLRG